MSDTAILVEHLSKEYTIGKKSTNSFRESFSNVFSGEKKSESFYALDDVSFRINRGEAVGIIGKNGAGKSTLLKIFSKITKPTRGRVEINGRIASLLEVGTGFHPELTGRQNVFLNGTMLGISKQEIRAKFDEIVAFSGVERFIDTPVKRYSSGMYVRLAFAVAAHLDSEILIIDEVLAVGDMAFQRKCLSNLGNLTKTGRTVLFVSHNHSQLKYLCDKGILLESGKLKFMGDMNKAIGLYTGAEEKALEIDTRLLPREGPKSPHFHITKIGVYNISRPDSRELFEKDEVAITYEFEVREELHELLIGFSFIDMFGNRVMECRSTATYPDLAKTTIGTYKAFANLRLSLEANAYTLNVGARSLDGYLEYVPGVTNLDILPLRNFEEWKKPDAGMFLQDVIWNIEKTI